MTKFPILQFFAGPRFEWSRNPMYLSMLGNIGWHVEWWQELGWAKNVRPHQNVHDFVVRTEKPTWRPNRKSSKTRDTEQVYRILSRFDFLFTHHLSYTVDHRGSPWYNIIYIYISIRQSVHIVHYSWVLRTNLLVKRQASPSGSVGLMANTWWCLAAMLPFAAYLNFCIVPAEEIYLRARFGSSHLDVEELDATLNFGVVKAVNHLNGCNLKRNVI